MYTIIDTLKSFFKLIRWFHELLGIFPFVTLYFIVEYYVEKEGIACNLSGFNFIILCLGVQLLIAAGCVLNDIIDRDIDSINKPSTHIVERKISLVNAKRIFVILTILIVILSIYIGFFVFMEWIYISITVYVLSVLYNLYFKRQPLIGNIVIALMAAFVPLVIFFFASDCIQTLRNEKIEVLIYLYSVFPFLIIIPRELSLDISDIEGDSACACKTLPIIIGVKKSKIVVTIFIVITIVLSFFIVYKYSYLIYAFLYIDVLLFIYIYWLYKCVKRIEYIKAGRFLWFTMIIGLIGFTLLTLY